MYSLWNNQAGNPEMIDRSLEVSLTALPGDFQYITGRFSTEGSNLVVLSGAKNLSQNFPYFGK
jgi:hypothetical protein